jgi:hypothetical protein
MLLSFPLAYAVVFSFGLCCCLFLWFMLWSSKGKTTTKAKGKDNISQRKDNNISQRKRQQHKPKKRQQHKPKEKTTT